MGQTKTDENRQKPATEALAVVCQQLTTDQLRFVVARQDHSSDKAAAEFLGISPHTVKDWKYKGVPIDEAVTLMAFDGLIVAADIRRRHLAKAMLVKVAGLDSDDERVRQNTATEVIEWEMGKAMQPTKQEMDGELTVRVIYGDGNTDTPT
jgi:hypothetical protein